MNWHDFFNHAFITILEALGAAVATFLLPLAWGWVKDRIHKWEAAQHSFLIEQAEKIVELVVAALDQEVVANLKEKAADGKLTREEVQEIQKKAAGKVLALLAPKLKVFLADSYGDVQTWIWGMIENKVRSVVKGKFPNSLTPFRA